MVYNEANRFKVRVGVVVLDSENRLLLSRQNGHPFWVLPGGTLELGETLGQCAVREIQEEAGLTIQLGPLLFVSEFFPQSQAGPVIDVIFFSQLQSGTLTPETTENIDDIRFFNIEEAQILDIKPKTIFALILNAWHTDTWQCGHYLSENLI